MKESEKYDRLTKFSYIIIKNGSSKDCLKLKKIKNQEKYLYKYKW